MRLTDCQIQTILQLAGNQCQARVFGSRLDDAAHGGDLDLMLELPEPLDNPALISAQMTALASRAMHGRKVDVLLSAPNLTIMKMLSSPRKMKVSCGSDAYVATKAICASCDVGVAPTRCVDDFHGNASAYS